MYSDEQLQELAQTVIDTYARHYNKKFNLGITVPVQVTFDLQTTKKWKSAGQARSNIFGSKVISESIAVNMPMFRENALAFLRDTLPHEVAHLAEMRKAARDRKKIKNNEHGDYWRGMMTAMRHTPSVFHNYNTASAQKAFNEAKAKKKAVKKATQES